MNIKISKSDYKKQKKFRRTLEKHLIDITRKLQHCKLSSIDYSVTLQEVMECSELLYDFDNIELLTATYNQTTSSRLHDTLKAYLNIYD